MSMRSLIGGLACLLAFSAAAQGVTPTARPSDQFAAPAVSGSASYPASRSLGAAAASPFKFKSSQGIDTAKPQPDPMAPTPVFGGTQIGPDGRPGVNCARTPNDPKCR